MVDSFFLGAYWGSRVEPATACGERLSRCLRRFADADPLLSHWLKVGSSHADSLVTRIDPANVEHLSQLIQERYDDNFPGLGFTLSMWDGREPRVSMSVTCGSDAKVSPNVVTLYPSLPEGEHMRLHEPETVMTVFRAVVEEWDPDWAFFGTRRMREIQGGYTGRPLAGWLSYVQSSSPTPSVAGIDVTPMGKGIILTAGPDPLHTTDEQIETAAALLSQMSRI